VLRVPYVDLSLLRSAFREEVLSAVEAVLSRGEFILGDEVAQFESEFAMYCGTRYAVGVANGTDALILCLKALGIGAGHEVITVPNSFVATAACIALVGAVPVFVDVGDDYNVNPQLIEGAITPRTRAILPVHLTGRPAEMRSIVGIAERYGLAVIEDAAQAVGARYCGQPVGSFGQTGCFSLHPLKNLGGCGDGGIIVTNDQAIYEHLIKARNHGLRNRDECDFWSINSRLDSLQAAILRVRLKHVDNWNQVRRDNAAFYRDALKGVVKVPEERPHEYSVYHTFMLRARRRDELQQYLLDRGVGCAVHYPIPIHVQEAYRRSGLPTGHFPQAEIQAQEILSLPVHPELTYSQLTEVVECIKEFYRANPA